MNVQEFLVTVAQISLTITALQIYIGSVPLSNYVVFIYMVALVWQLYIAFLGFAMLLYGARNNPGEE